MPRRTREVSVSKLLSYALRHEPHVFGVELDDAGWIDVETLLAAFAAKGQPVSRDEVLEVVRTSDKQRFVLSPDGSRIRANQGHSVAVDLGYVPVTPPDVSFHGTVARFVEAILRQGLLPGKRRHVHLSESVELAERVGRRRGRSVVLCVRALGLAATGHVFFRAPNGVWLTERVPPEYIELTPGDPEPNAPRASPQRA